MHVLTLVANSTLLNYIRRNYRTYFAGWHCWNGVNKTKGIEESTVQRHGKEVRNLGEGGGSAMTGVKYDAQFSKIFFYRLNEELRLSIVKKHTFQKDNF